MADGPARIKAFGDFGITAWTTVRNEDLPTEAIGPIEYVRADIAEGMFAALEAVSEWEEQLLGIYAHMPKELGDKVHAAIATAKGEANG